ncbi:CBL-interacting serine/threonine-protein kinase 10 [Tanacetum coccineum]|uniref:CBL-interacting serine/threonine-protein kinase 10 n=1 Tax=Tanacetum coccineum TaxID=301880 RepID=A0ABQ5G7C1_9ASTR
MMQDNDLKNSKSKDKGSRSRSQSMDEQSRYKQDKTKTRQSINVKSHIFNIIRGTEEFEERDLNIGGDFVGSDAVVIFVVLKWCIRFSVVLYNDALGKRLRMKVTKREAGLLKLEAIEEGRKGILSIDAEIFELTQSFHLVEVKKCNGDTLEYHNVVEHLRPRLQEIAWDEQIQ